MAAYFFVLIPPRLLTSKAPALWRSRTECDWEIWRSIFSQSTHLPRGDSIWFFFFLPFFLFCFFCGFTMNLWISAREEELGSELNQLSSYITGAAFWLALAGLFQKSLFPLSQPWWCSVACWKHITALQPAQNGWTFFSWIYLPEEGVVYQGVKGGQWQIQSKAIMIILFLKNYTCNRLQMLKRQKTD